MHDYMTSEIRAVMSRAQYMQTIWMVRNYPRMERSADPKQTQRADAIRQCLDDLPPEYRTDIMSNIIDGTAHAPGLQRVCRMRARFLINVARALYII